MLSENKTSTPRKRIKKPEESSDSEGELKPLAQRVTGSSILKKPGVDLSVSFSDSDGDSSDAMKSRQKKSKTNKRDKDGFLEPSLPAPRADRLVSTSSVSNISMMSTRSSRPKNPWSKKETEDLYQGVKIKGVGKWVDIRSLGNFKYRTNVQLKDRWRSMLKDKSLMMSLQAKYGPVN